MLQVALQQCRNPRRPGSSSSTPQSSRFVLATPLLLGLVPHKRMKNMGPEYGLLWRPPPSMNGHQSSGAGARVWRAQGSAPCYANTAKTHRPLKWMCLSIGGVLFTGVLIMRALLFGVYIKAEDFWKPSDSFTRSEGPQQPAVAL